MGLQVVSKAVQGSPHPALDGAYRLLQASRDLDVAQALEESQGEALAVQVRERIQAGLHRA